MHSSFGAHRRTCKGPSRRSFLAAGALGFGALTLVDLLRAEAAAGIRSSTKSIINIHLDGGPPQMDTIDMKPDAPAEIRDEFRPIATILVGLQICELLPKVASIADRFAFLRSLVGSAGEHDAFQCQTGYPAADSLPECLCHPLPQHRHRRLDDNLNRPEWSPPIPSRPGSADPRTVTTLTQRD